MICSGIHKKIKTYINNFSTAPGQHGWYLPLLRLLLALCVASTCLTTSPPECDVPSPSHSVRLEAFRCLTKTPSHWTHTVSSVCVFGSKKRRGNSLIECSWDDAWNFIKLSAFIFIVFHRHYGCFPSRWIAGSQLKPLPDLHIHHPSDL